MSPTDTASIIQHRIGASGSITVRTADWDVELAAIDGDVVRVRSADGGKLPASIEVDRTSDSLTVRQPSRLGLAFGLGGGSSTTRLAIEVPTLAAATIQTASGDVHVANLRGPLKARTTAGDLIFVDVAGDVQAETVSGDVAIRIADSAVLAVRTVSGDAIVEGGVIDQFAFTTTSGDLRVTSELGAGPHTIATVSGDAIITTRTGIRVAAQTVAGDLRSDLPHLSEGRPGRRSLVVGEGSAAVQFRSVSGDLRVVGPNGAGHSTIPGPPKPPAPPTPPAAPVPPATASALGAGTDSTESAATRDESDDSPTDEPADDPRLDILRALERGDIDVDEATKRLAAMDGPGDD